jgi:hypothetical protein
MGPGLRRDDVLIDFAESPTAKSPVSSTGLLNI